MVRNMRVLEASLNEKEPSSDKDSADKSDEKAIKG